jgi:hypothetical protein
MANGCCGEGVNFNLYPRYVENDEVRVVGLTEGSGRTTAARVEGERSAHDCLVRSSMPGWKLRLRQYMMRLFLVPQEMIGLSAGGWR